MFAKIMSWFRDPVKKLKIENLTFEQCHQYHKELWTWLAETGGDNKKAWPGWDKFDNTPHHACFACVVAIKLATTPTQEGRLNIRRCDHCPIEWSNGFGCQDDLYRSLWYTAEERKPLAQQIANLPWKNKWSI